MNVKLISITKPEIQGINTAEELIVYCARVSNPSNQMNMETAPKLLSYLIKNKHWSPLEMASMCVEIKTSRGIAAQILRHRSFSFQEFSQRYSEIQNFEPIELRLQGQTNRQVGDKSLEELYPAFNDDIQKEIADLQNKSYNLYKKMVNNKIAKESARFILPLSTETTIYMSGTIRSFVHYIQIRSDIHTQKEHRLIAEEIKKIFINEFPNISEALDFNKN